jgi:hypothetical protein
MKPAARGALNVTRMTSCTFFQTQQIQDIMDTFSHRIFKILRDKRMNTHSLAALHNIFPDQVINYLSPVPPPIHAI